MQFRFRRRITKKAVTDPVTSAQVRPVFRNLAIECGHSSNDALNKFDHYEKKIEVMESEIEANDIGNRGIAAEFDALEKEGRIDKELEALKSKLKEKK